MTTRTTVTGPPNAGSGIQAKPPPRRDIFDLIKDEMQFSLFVQALTRLSQTPEQQSISHYQVGGIHGLPYERWEGAGPEKPVGGWKGYCNHGSVLFPTWHRPYMSLYEQLIHQHAVDIAKNMPTAWKKSAEDLRYPYWDWAVKAVPPPEVIEYKTLQILQPDGTKKTVDNPIITYKFQKPLDPSFGTLTKWSTTVRRPDANNITVQAWKDIFIGSQPSIKRNVFDLLTRVHDWVSFAHHVRNSGPTTTPVSSLESIHDTMHVNIGGAGFMGRADAAGFDPIFYLHHANVDRLLSLWQALNSNVWVSKDVAKDGGSWTQAEGETVDSTSQLAPFWSPITTGGSMFWTSDHAREWEAQLNFTYPEFVGVDRKDWLKVIAAKVLNLYGSQNIMQPTGTSAFAADDAQDADVQDVGVQAAGDQDVDVDSYEWKAGIEVEQFALDTSFSVCVFVLAPGVDKSSISDTDSTQWCSSPYFAGQTSVFFNGVGSERCGNCQAQEAQHVIVEGFLHLNEIIKASGKLTPTEENDNDVHEFLKAHVIWKVCKANGEVVPASSIPSLKVTIYSTESSIPERSLPGGVHSVFGSDFKTVRVRKEVTSGKAGGHGHAE